MPIIGATVLVKGGQNGTVTNAEGAFSLKIEEEPAIIIVSFIGYLSKEVVVGSDHHHPASIRLQLEEDIHELDEVIVTGVFDRRKRIESSIAITTIDSKALDRIVSNSAVELLRQVPGVFTNTTRGEIYNSVVVRGMVLGEAYYYVSMQEDGLPIIPAAGQFSPDAFLRADVSIGRIEAVRGGTASILGVNAPGGIFNYISKTGSGTFDGEVRTRVGLEGDGKNPYYRLEVGFGGPLSKKDSSLTYFVSGHYRHANGAKYPGYPLSRGGQVKTNLVKKYKQGYFQLNLKYLHDRTVQFESTPSVNFDEPRPAGNFTTSSSTLNPDVTLNYPASILGLTDIVYDSKNLNLYKDFSPGFNWEHRFGNGWKLQNAFRYSDKSVFSNSSFIVYPFSVDKFLFYAINGLLGQFGTYNFYNPKTNQSYGSVTQEFDVDNPNFPFRFNANLNLPGSEVQPNSVFYNPISYERGTMKDMVNQFTVKKQLENMGFTAGIFHATTWLKYYLTPPAANSYGTIEDKPQLVAIDFIPAFVDNPQTYHYTDQNGISAYGVGGLFHNEATVNQTAFFFGHNWDVTEHLNVDWGARYENYHVKGNLVRSGGLLTSLGGVDGDSTTLYDNNSYTLGDYVHYDSPLNTFSFSGGVNYKINNGLAFYARYSQGSKTPDFNFFYDNSKVFDIEAQRTVQLELGIKVSKGKNNLFITPFYSALDKVPQIGRGQNDGPLPTFYATPKIYNKTHAIGIEAEGNYVFNERWSIRANAMVQQFTADKYQFYDVRQNGPADDTLIDRSNKKISSAAPPFIFNITPAYSHNKWFINLNWFRMGKRAANTSETFYLPAFSQFDCTLGYAISNKIHLQASINNIFDKYGIMSWSAPTTSGLPFETFDVELFTPEKRAANPDVVFYTLGIQPRAYFLSGTLKL
ncbi:MAG: TonB-dependent receptor [Lewinellaceae bacterium]|nr:TonB-dependent receptor [Lewinellaceae bacterium]